MSSLDHFWSRLIRLGAYVVEGPCLDRLNASIPSRRRRLSTAPLVTPANLAISLSG